MTGLRFPSYILGFALLAKGVHYFMTRKARNISTLSRPVNKSINEVLFFPDIEYPCPAVIKTLTGFRTSHAPAASCRNPSCRKLHGRPNESPSSLIKLLSYLVDAKYTVDVCIFLFTQPTLAKVILGLHSSGIRVRVITDASEDDAQSSQVDSLRRAGIEIKSNKRGTGALMHHKFFMIDSKVLISGSFNWTNKAVVSNYEAVVVTSELRILYPFAREFERLWNEFKQHPKRM